MINATKKTLNDVAPTSERLRIAYDALMVFSPSSLAQTPIPTEFLQQMATQEATADPLHAGEHGLTSGMKSVLRQAAVAPLAPWSTLRGDFESAVQPFIDKINAVRDFEAKKAAIDRKTDDREAAILAEAEAQKLYGDRKAAKENADRHFDLNP